MENPPFGEIKRECLAALGAYAGLVGICYAIGYRMHIPFWYLQFLDKFYLETRLAESLYYLHSQPPLLNLMAGVAIKLGNALGTTPEAVLYPFHIALGAAMTVGFSLLCGIFLPNRRLRRICLAILVFHPAFYMVLHHFFYTFHELFIFALFPVLIWRYFTTRSNWAFAAVCLLATILTLERSLFHFLWALGIPTALLLPIHPPPIHPPKDRPAPSRAIPILLTLLTFTALIAWPMKNKVVFDTFSYSSWQGYSLARGLGLDLINEHLIPVSTPPGKFAEIPVLTTQDKSDAPAKGPPERNWNSYSYMLEFQNRQKLALKTIRAEPIRLLKKAAVNYWCVSRFTGRQPHVAYMGTIAKPAPPLAEPWMLLYEALLVQEFRGPLARQHPFFRPEGHPTRWWDVSGLFFTMPLVLFFALYKTLRLWRTSPLEARMAGFLLYCAFWVLAIMLLVDGDEGNRIRTSTEPYLIVLAFWVGPELLRPILSRVGKQAREAKN